MAVTQPLMMYVFLRVLKLRFFVSAALAAIVAMLVGFSLYFIQSRIGPRKKIT